MQQQRGTSDLGSDGKRQRRHSVVWLYESENGCAFDLVLPLRQSLRQPAAQDGASQNPDPDADGDDEKPGPDHLFGVLISIKSFVKFLNSHVLSSTTIACELLRVVVSVDILMFFPR